MQQWTIYYLPDNPEPIGLGYDLQIQNADGSIDRIPQIVHYFNKHNV
jgi:hypothetical protein